MKRKENITVPESYHCMFTLHWCTLLFGVAWTAFSTHLLHLTFPLESLLPTAKGTATAWVTWLGGIGFAVAALALLLRALENWVTFWNSARGSARSCCLFRGIAEVAGTSVSSGFYCSPSLYGNRCIQMLTPFLSCFAPLPQDPHKTEHRCFQVMQRCCSLKTYFMWCCSGAGTALQQLQCTGLLWNSCIIFLS